MCIGCMFAGKTQWLIDQYNHGACPVAFKPSVDVRYAISSITSHRSCGARPASCQVSIPAVCGQTVRQCAADMDPSCTTVCIDEGQFFPDLLEGCLDLVRRGKDVYVAALKGMADGGQWPSVSAIIPHADDLVMLHSTECSECGYWKAPHTVLRIDSGGFDAGNPVRIG